MAGAREAGDVVTAIVKPKILCVDDEPNVLAAFQLNLRRDFEVVAANGGEQALSILETTPDIKVLMCDMRMPRMNGAAVLTRARELYPHISRVLLTGQADTSSAISAVNDGQIFRYLTKPCDREPLVAALTAAVEHHRLVTAEKVLLQETLRGAVAALCDVLALASPLAFGRANRVKARSHALAEQLALPDAWQLEMAVSLQHVGYISLPPATLEKLYAGKALSDDEAKQVARVPEVTEQLFRHIPRLEVIREIVGIAARQAQWSGVAGESATEIAGAILWIANDADAIETSGVTGEAMVKLLRQRGRHCPKVVDALEVVVGSVASTYIAELPLIGLKVGMVLADDIFLNGALLVSRGYVVAASFLERTRHFQVGAVKEPIRILVDKSATSK
jgi:response regulator RpfG family c-di-GMP phosphodiesterase